MKRHFLLFLLASFSILSGCSDNQDEASFVIGMEANYPPFNWTEQSKTDDNVLIEGKQNEYAYGYDVRVARFIAEDNGWKLSVKAMGWDALIPSLSSGQISAICAGMSATSERLESIDFTNPYYDSTLVLVTRKDDPRFLEGKNFDFKSASKGVKLITQSGTFEDDIASDWARDYEAIHCGATDTYPDAFYQVERGNADAVICEKPVAKSTTSTLTDLQIITFDNSLLDEKYQEQTKICLGIKKGDPNSIKEKINASLAKLDESTREKWMDEAIAKANAK